VASMAQTVSSPTRSLKHIVHEQVEHGVLKQLHHDVEGGPLFPIGLDVGEEDVEHPPSRLCESDATRSFAIPASSGDFISPRVTTRFGRGLFITHRSQMHICVISFLHVSGSGRSRYTPIPDTRLSKRSLRWTTRPCCLLNG
jgi:hypothetical protein